MQSNAHLGSGILSGVMSGKSIERLAKNPKAKAVMERICLKKDIIPKIQQGKKVDTQEVIKILENSPQKGRDMVVIGRENFTPEIVEYIYKNDKKVAIDKVDSKQAKRLGFKHPNDVRATIDYQAINHTLKRHGIDSILVKQSGQKAVDYNDIANYRNITRNANESLNSINNSGNPVLVSYKQVNGHFVVVEQVKKKNNELGFKTMFKGNGDYKASQSYKETSAKAQTLSIGYEPSANSFAKPDN
ncbi:MULTISPECIES: hypothetical protein [Helicobacter]|uniref:PBECR3 domain-containing polyvalent protein n=1 Tax=Helicobacter TaxID=209 RepID=UPI00030B161A|nr:MULTISPECIES: hypothetical protein [Helicobacter]